MPVAADDLGGHSESGNAVFYASHRGTPGEGVNLQKHGRLTRLARGVMLPVFSPHRLAASSTGRASAVRPRRNRSPDGFGSLPALLFQGNFADCDRRPKALPLESATL